MIRDSVAISTSLRAFDDYRFGGNLPGNAGQPAEITSINPKQDLRDLHEVDSAICLEEQGKRWDTRMDSF